MPQHVERRIVLPDEKFGRYEVSMGQDYLDGLHALILWLQGFEAGRGQGVIPGMWELIVFYRSLSPLPAIATVTAIEVEER